MHNYESTHLLDSFLSVVPTDIDRISWEQQRLFIADFCVENRIMTLNGIFLFKVLNSTNLQIKSILYIKSSDVNYVNDEHN